MLKIRFRSSVWLSFGVLLLALFAFTAFPVHAATDCATADVSQAQCEALVALYNSTGGNSWFTKTNWLQNQTVCGWHGVGCTGNAVGALSLFDNNLVGTIPTEIGNLTDLQILYLDGNQLSGSIPAEIGSLTSLQFLVLSSNQLSGSIPAEIGNLTDLLELYLSGNQLSGSIPTEIGNLTDLQSLDLSGNQLSGSIPTEIGNLTDLQFLDLSGNQLSGTIPTEIGNLTSLVDLQLYSNQLSGSIPTEIGNLTSLLALALNSNQLSGSVPAEIGNLTNLQLMRLSNNQFTALPVGFTALTSLTNLRVEYNRFPVTGLDAALEAFLNNRQPGWQTTQTVPPDAVMVGATTVTSVDLSWTPVGDTTSGGYYEVGVSTTDGGPYTFDPANRTADKSATGITVGNLTPATTYYLVVRAYRAASWYAEDTSIASAQVSATPAVDCATADVSQAQCEALVALYNSTGGDSWTTKTNWLQNQTVCTWHGVTCTGNAVVSLDLFGNNLVGSIPPEIGNLTDLQVLYLSVNQLSGSIPTEIGSLTDLQVLYLSVNQLSGSIPAEIGNLTSLLELWLFNNQLSGSIPAEIGNLTDLQSLYLSGNQLSGSIPTEIGNLTSLQLLDLSGNQLSGSIPAQIGNLTDLQYLYLDSNQLSGSIPAEIGNLTNLLLMWLFNNQFTGLPVELAALTSLTNLAIEYNLLPVTGLDAALEAFLNNRQPGWQTTQTVPPDAVMVGATTVTSVDLSWTPVGDTTSGGYYEVGVSTTDGGPYTFDAANRTADKSLTGITVTNLASGTTYYLVVRAYRAASEGNYAEATSLDSAQVSAATTEVPGIELVVNGGFEEIDGSGKPDLLPWIVKNPTKDKVRCNSDVKIIAYSGNCAFVFKGGPGEASALQQSAVVSSLPAAVGDEIVFNQYVQAINAAASGKYKVVLKYSDAPTEKITGTITTAADYTLLSGSFNLASANITKIKLQIRHSSPAGKVYVDAVSLTLNPAGAASLGSRTIPLP